MELSWARVHENISTCQACGLCRGIHQKVPGQGCLNARLMIIGEGPGYQEDLQGLAFVGPAGLLLTKMLSSIGLARDEVYITNIVKCRPPDNRTPSLEEALACKPHLRAQTALVRPQIILLMGSTALQNTLSPEARITKERGKWTERKGFWLLPTYHPAALLRDESKKRDAWHDMQAIQAKLIELGEKNDP